MMWVNMDIVLKEINISLWLDFGNSYQMPFLDQLVKTGSQERI